MLLRLLKWAFFLGVFVSFLVAYSLATGKGDQEKTVLIQRGVPVGKIGLQLQAEGVISNPYLFKMLVLGSGGNRRVKAGEYAFKTEMGPLNAVMVLYFSDPVEHVVTVPEGWNARQIAAIFAAQKLVDPQKFVDIVLSRKSAMKYKLSSPTLEGFLFPDTYTFSRIDGEERIVDRLVQRFFAKVDQNLIASAKRQGMTLESLVTLASIIEKETGVPVERELISSVFHNRLKKKMRLQSDPTTIYGISNFNGNLTRKDLLTSTAYNTYTIAALPPGAICSPGLSALQATVNPAKTKYLYFVANNQHAHIFTETYAEHSKAVDRYQKRHPTRKADSERQIGNIRK
jgi:UPF0755 protein